MKKSLKRQRNEIESSAGDGQAAVSINPHKKRKHDPSIKTSTTLTADSDLTRDEEKQEISEANKEIERFKRLSLVPLPCDDPDKVPTDLQLNDNDVTAGGFHEVTDEKTIEVIKADLKRIDIRIRTLLDLKDNNAAIVYVSARSQIAGMIYRVEIKAGSDTYYIQYNKDTSKNVNNLCRDEIRGDVESIEDENRAELKDAASEQMEVDCHDEYVLEGGVCVPEGGVKQNKGDDDGNGDNECAAGKPAQESEVINDCQTLQKGECGDESERKEDIDGDKDENCDHAAGDEDNGNDPVCCYKKNSHKGVDYVSVCNADKDGKAESSCNVGTCTDEESSDDHNSYNVCHHYISIII